MSEALHESKDNEDYCKDENEVTDEQPKDKSSAFEKYKSPLSVAKKTSKLLHGSDRKEALDVNVSPLCKDLLQHIKHMGDWTKDSKRDYHLSTPKSPNKLAIMISPGQNDSFVPFPKDDFQLKNESDQKHSKMIEFYYPDALLSKSDSSKKINIKKIIKGADLDDEGCLKRRLFEKESSDYDCDESSNYNILSYNDNLGYVDNLITPPPKTTRRLLNVPTDHKLSGVKYAHNEVLEQKHLQRVDPHYVFYKSYKCKQSSYPYLIPFCNKCNLPPILPILPGFEMEMVPPPPMPPVPAVQPPLEKFPVMQPYSVEREPASPAPAPSPIPRPKSKMRNKKKPSVDEHGKKIIRRRKRKSYEQLQMLVREFQANPDWSKENMQEVSRKTGLSEAQVYKWGWDQKRKIQEGTHDLQAELRMYKKQQEEEEENERAAMQMMKLPSSLKKPAKTSQEFQWSKDNSSSKTRRALKSAFKGDPEDNKENMPVANKGSKTETRGVRRKIKALNFQE